MNRREALSAVSFLLGGTIIGAEAFLSGCSKRTPVQTGFLNEDEISFLDEVGETIIPTTASSPGAKEAEIGSFMNSIVTDCYSQQEQMIFKEGMKKLDIASDDKYSERFIRLSPEKKHELLLTLDAEAAGYAASRKPEDPETHYYSMMKQLTVWGYFTSEVGATKALRHVAVPGRWESCIPLRPGDKAWG
jgi:glucoside 3-dehydrogenase (cytochrome c) hitch-hiker subunit